MLPHTKRYLLLDNNVSLWLCSSLFCVNMTKPAPKRQVFSQFSVKELELNPIQNLCNESGYIWVTDCTAEWRFRSQALMETPVSLCLWERPLITVGIHHLRNVWSAILSLGFSRPFFVFQSNASLDISNDFFYVGQALRAAMETCLFISQSDGSCFT